jgi:integrase
MRRSEICAITVDDIEGNVVHINKALVENEDNEWIVKTTKTAESTRDIVIPMETADKIRQKGYAYKGHPNHLSKVYGRIEKELGIPHFSPHKLRHYFASRMSALGVPEADILKMGGWETDNVMKSVYRHSMIDNEKQQEISAKLSREFFS